MSSTTQRLPDFAIIGAQKAASTLLLNSMREHPEAWLPPTEQPYFRDPFHSPDGFEAFRVEYVGRTEPRLGLKCPDYLARPEVPARLTATLDRPDLVVCLRDPVARAVSAYFWRVRWGMLPVLPVEIGMRRILDGELRDHDPTVGEVLDWSRYGVHLGHWLDAVPREKLMILVDEDLRTSPDAAVNQVARFLGIAERGVGDVPRRRANEGVYSLPRLRLGRPRAALVRRWNADRTYAALAYPDNPVARAVNTALAGIDHVILSRVFGNQRPVLPAALEQELREYFAEDVRAVEGLLDRGLRWGPSSRPGPTGSPVAPDAGPC